MDIGWKVMIPLGLVNFVVVATWMEFGDRAASRIGLSAPWDMAIVGWPVLLVSWLVISIFDPTAGGRSSKKRMS